MAKILSCLLFTLCTLVLFLNVAGQIIPLGAIFDPNTRKGKEEKIAITLAVQDFSSNSNPTFIINSTDVNSADPLLSSNYAQELVGWGAQIIISTRSIPQMLYDANIVPIVSLVPSSLPLKPFLAQMSYSDAAFIKCIVAIVKSFNWRRVISIYEDDEYGTMSNTVILLSHALKAVGSELEYSAVFEPLKVGSDPKPSIQAELEEMKKQLSTVYVVLHSSEALAVSLFQGATAKGMMGAGSVWICGNDITSLLDSTFYPSFISSYMQGVLGVESYINVSNTGYPSFSSSFQQAFKNEFEKKGEKIFAPGVFAFRAYDTVQAIRRASIVSQMNGKPLTENLLATNFNGFSERNSTTFRIINVVGRSYKDLGFWVDGFGFYGKKIELSAQSSKNLNVVLWPGDLKTNPGGLRKLRVGLPANPVWREFVNVSVDKNRIVTNATGFCIDVFTKVLERMEKNNYKIEYEYVPFLMGVNSSFNYEFNPLDGTKTSSDFTYDDLVNQVHLKSVDIIIGDVTILSSRSQNVSFTEPFLSSGLVSLVPLENDNPRWLLLRPFQPTLWLAIFGLMLFIFLSIWYLERYDDEAHADFHGPWYKQIGATFWIIGNTIYQTYGDKIGTYYTKIVIVCWMLVILILSNTYTANLSSILVLENLKPRIDESKIGCDGDSFVKNYLINVLKFNNGSIVEVRNNSDYPNAFQSGNISVAYLEIPYARVFLSKYEGYTVYGKVHSLGGFGFVLPKFSSMTFDMSKAILELQEDGNITKLEENSFHISFGTTMSPSGDTRKQRLDLASFVSLFTFCFCVAIGVVVIFKIRKKRKEQAKIVPETQDEEMESAHKDQDHRDTESQ